MSREDAEAPEVREESWERLEQSGYAYPEDLARFVSARWPEIRPVHEAAAATRALESRPRADLLERLFSTCYHASHLREEGRPVTFRAILAAPDTFAARGGPPEGVHPLELVRPLPLDPRELRRLSVGADFSRSLIGVGVDADGRLRIWGLIHQGPRWLRDVVGGRGGGPSLPPAPVVDVTGPGSLAARKGLELVGRLEGGRLFGARLDVFASRWLPAAFDGFLDELLAVHAAARARAEARGERWAPLDRDLARRIAERMLKRVVSVVREGRHGGTVIFAPFASAAELRDDNPYLDIKYPFAEAEVRTHFLDLIVRMLNRLAQVDASAERGAAGGAEYEPVGWAEFESSADEEVAALDESLFEFAYLIAGLAAVDGAVVMDTRVELLGFGAEISGKLPAVTSVARALDLEGESAVEESAASEGTRHRSAYRLAGALAGSVLVVISQDGRVHFIRNVNGRVTYWEHE